MEKTEPFMVGSHCSIKSEDASKIPFSISELGITVPQRILWKIQRLFNNFIWDRTCPRIKVSVMQLQKK